MSKHQITLYDYYVGKQARRRSDKALAEIRTAVDYDKATISNLHGVWIGLFLENGNNLCIPIKRFNEEWEFVK
jgi:hypothetical protein